MKFFAKPIAALSLILAVAAPLAAQTEDERESKGKPNVLIDYFWRSTDIPFSATEQLRGYVMEGITNTNRVDLIDVDTKDALRIEASRREQGVEAGDDADRLKVMTQEGANFLISGRVNSLTVEKQPSSTDPKKMYYVGKIDFTLKVINPNDGKLVLTRTFSHGGEMIGDNLGDTPEEAITLVTKKSRDGVKGFVQEAFPLFGLLLEVGEVKDGKLNSAYISLGENHGLATKDRFDVCVVREIAGRRSTSKIGEAEVAAIEGDDISLVKIRKNQKEVKEAVDGGQRVVFKSVPKPPSIKDKVNKLF